VCTAGLAVCLVSCLLQLSSGSNTLLSSSNQNENRQLIGTSSAAHTLVSIGQQGVAPKVQLQQT